MEECQRIGVLLSLEQQGSLLAYCLVVRFLRSEWAFDLRDTVLLIGLYWSIQRLPMLAQSWWMSVCCAEWKTGLTSFEFSWVVWCAVPGSRQRRIKHKWQKRHHYQSALKFFVKLVARFQTSRGPYQSCCSIINLKLFFYECSWEIGLASEEKG